MVTATKAWSWWFISVLAGLVVLSGCQCATEVQDVATAPAPVSAEHAPEVEGDRDVEAARPRPHVLLITIDALRADHLGVYGYERATSPFLDRFARESWVYEHAYAAAPNSSYSMCAMLTGEYVSERVRLGGPLPTITLASALRDVGYRSQGFYIEGIFYTDGARLSAFRDGGLGFDEHHAEHRPADELTSDVIAAYRQIAQGGEPPSFFWVHYFDVHEPYRATTFGDADLDRYDSEILRVDQQVQRLWTEVQQLLQRDVVVAIASDHGEEFREHGGLYHGSTAYEEQIRVPLIIRVPGAVHHQVSAPVSLVDLPRTLLALAGVEAPSSMRGRDLAPPVERRPVFASVGHRRMVVDWPWKLITDPRTEAAELYNLVEDPDERDERSLQTPEVVTRLRGLGSGWVETLRAPRGEVASLEPSVRALHLGRLRDRRAVPDLLHLMLEPAAPVEGRVEAIELLGAIGTTAAMSALRRARREPSMSPAMRHELALTLGNRGDPSVRASLLGLLQNPDRDVRDRAATGLGHLGDTRAVGGLVDIVGREGVAPTEVSRAIYWLGRLGDSRAIEPLADLARRESRHRYRASRALGEIGDRAATDALLGLLEMRNRTTVRDIILEALGRVGDERAGQAVLEATRAHADATRGPLALFQLDMVERGEVAGVDLGARAARHFQGARPRCASSRRPEVRRGCTFGAGLSRLRLARPVGWDEADRDAVLALAIRAPERGASIRVEVDGRELVHAAAESHWTDVRLPIGPLPPELQLTLGATGGAVEVDYILVY